jgi:hypothetical protein
MAKRRTNPKLALRIARAQLRAVKAAVGQYTTPLVVTERSDGTPKFIQCWSVQRGGFSAVTQALDASGQVWERVSLMGEEIINDKKVKVLKESWWEPLAMDRRERKEEKP